MTEDEKFVRDHWEVHVSWGRTFPGHSTPTFHLKLPVIWHDGLNVMFAQSAEKAWSAAAEFTRERLEQIRQIEEEYVVLGANQIRAWREAGLCSDWSEGRTFFFVEWVRIARTMSRLESILAGLKRGMK